MTSSRPMEPKKDPEKEKARTLAIAVTISCQVIRTFIALTRFFGGC